MQLCDVLNQEQLDRNFKGVDTVVHCAVGNADVIVNGTANTLEAAYKHRVKRFVHISTAAVYGNVSEEIDETWPCTSMKNEYADSKIEAEKLCWQYSSKGLPVVILRPSIIYGPFGNVFVVRIAEGLYAGTLGDMKDTADGFCNLVYVDDIVHSIFLSIIKDQATGQAFNINGPDKITWNDYFTELAAALGITKMKDLKRRESKVRSTTIGLIRPAASYMGKHYGDLILQMGAKVGLERRIERLRSFVSTTPSNFELTSFSRKAYYSYAKAAKILGYSPRFNMFAGLDLSAKWFAHEGHLQRFAGNNNMSEDSNEKCSKRTKTIDV
jgi:nucleoside-diphosphate-sugar epimerase